MTDCAPYLNGYQKGSRWEGNFNGSPPSGRQCGGINTVSTWSAYTKDYMTRFITAQIDAYLQKTQGFFFWNFKTEGAAEWDMFALLDAGVFPNLKNYQPKSICTS